MRLLQASSSAAERSVAGAQRERERASSGRRQSACTTRRTRAWCANSIQGAMEGMTDLSKVGFARSRAACEKEGKSLTPLPVWQRVQAPTASLDTLSDGIVETDASCLYQPCYLAFTCSKCQLRAPSSFSFVGWSASFFRRTPTRVSAGRSPPLSAYRICLACPSCVGVCCPLVGAFGRWLSATTTSRRGRRREDTGRRLEGERRRWNSPAADATHRQARLTALGRSWLSAGGPYEARRPVSVCLDVSPVLVSGSSLPVG